MLAKSTHEDIFGNFEIDHNYHDYLDNDLDNPEYYLDNLI